MRLNRVIEISLAIGLSLPGAAWATSDPLSGLLSAPGSAGLGFGLRSVSSPYVGGGTRHDLMPLYLYEGERLFLHTSRAGLKLLDDKTHGADVFLDYRFEGFPYDRIPPSLAGMAARSPGLDLGVSYEYRTGWGKLHAEFVHDAQNTSKGDELRLGYSYDWRSGYWSLRPSLTVSGRSARLNNYYYGVRSDEATAVRPAYAPGAGIDTSLGLYGSYDVSERWRLIGGVGVTYVDRKVRNSPIVRDGVQPALFVGAAYDFGAHRRLWADESSRPSVKLLYRWRKAQARAVRRFVRACLFGDYQPLIGAALFAECEDVLSRDALWVDSLLPARKRREVCDGFLSVCRWVEVFLVWRPNLTDEADNHLVELAMAGNATAIVTRNTRDPARGELRFPSVKIWTPEQCLETYPCRP